MENAQQQQPKSTAQLIALILEDFHALCEAAASEEAKKQVDLNAKSLAEQVALNADVDLSRYSIPVPSADGSHITAVGLGAGALFSKTYKSPYHRPLEEQFRAVLQMSLCVQRAFAALIAEFLKEFPSSSAAEGGEEGDILDSDGGSGYYVGNLIMFGELTKKILEQHESSLKGLHEAIPAVISNSSVDLKTAKARAQVGQLFIIRHRSKCGNPQCTSPFKDKGDPAVAKSVLQGVLLCSHCVKIEEAAIKAPLKKQKNGCLLLETLN